MNDEPEAVGPEVAPAPGVAVVGSISADLTVFGHPLPRPGETVIAERFSLVLGGKGANQALAATRAGAPTYLIGAVGDDLFRAVTLDTLAAESVDTTHVLVTEGSTGIAHIRVDTATGQNDIAIVPHANHAVTPEHAEQSLRALAGLVSVVLVQLETPIAVVARVAQVAADLGMRLILDPAPAQPLPDELWRGVAVVTPNELEAATLTGLDVTDLPSAQAAGSWFVERGVLAAVITRAERGAVVVRAGSVTEHPALPVTPVDTTAAGDAFAGALGAALAAGSPWSDAVERAMAAGALAVTVVGASPSLPTAAQVDAFLAEQARPSS